MFHRCSVDFFGYCDLGKTDDKVVMVCDSTPVTIAGARCPDKAETCGHFVKATDFYKLSLKKGSGKVTKRKGRLAPNPYYGRVRKR